MFQEYIIEESDSTLQTLPMAQCAFGFDVMIFVEPSRRPSKDTPPSTSLQDRPEPRVTIVLRTISIIVSPNINRHDIPDKPKRIISHRLHLCRYNQSHGYVRFL